MKDDSIARLTRPILRFLRRRRMRVFVESLALTSDDTVLDVGGTAFNWELSPVQPRLTLLNLMPSDSGHVEVVGDGTRLPFRDAAFDVVFSNSVIEHVPDHAAFAAEIRRVARRYFVQTPNKAFPFEPHAMTPFVNYLPARWKLKLYRNFTVWGLLARPSASYLEWFVQDVDLLTQRQMRTFFPEARLRVGRSLIATGRPAHADRVRAVSVLTG